jgi:hypothetical protein
MQHGQSASRLPRGTPRPTGEQRRGNILVLSSFLMVIMMAMVAFACDIGYMCVMRARLQRAVDAAALAGTQDLVNGVQAAQDRAKEYLVRNPLHNDINLQDEQYLLDAIQTFDEEHAEGMELKIGNWNPVSRQFEETDVLPSSMQVRMEYNNLPFFFGRVLGKDTFDLVGESTAMYQPRDIMVVLDFSASMNDDSEFSAFSKLGQTEVEANLADIYADLGSPTYGNMTFQPQWLVAKGVPENTSNGIPHITTEYRFSSVYLTSTASISSVRLQFSNGSTQTFSPNTLTGTFAGTGSNAGRQIVKVWVKSWNNSTLFGSYGELFDFNGTAFNTTAKKALGLNTVPYPYPSGSWDTWIDWCESSSNQNKNAGYRHKFGYMNWIVWMLENRPGYSQTPDLWKVRAEPINALKSSVDVFMDFVASVDTNDQVGLSVYNGSNGEGLLEVPLTRTYQTIVDTMTQRQAGHYHQYTNIGGGLKSARLHMDSNARANAKKMIVLMTDGVANWVNGGVNESGARNFLIQEAYLCAAESRKYPVMTISLGAGADTALMQQVADITGGTHFNVPGGSSQDDYYQQLYDVFEAIAKARPLKLVK